MQIYVDKGTRDVWFIKGLKWIDGAEDCALMYSADDFEEIEEYFEEFLVDTEKPKAYHITDEYSYDCLMKELEYQGCEWYDGNDLTKFNVKNAPEFDEWNIYIVLEDGYLSWSDSDLPYPELYEIVEYHKEEPKLRARIKEELNIPLLARDYYFVKASKELKTSKSTKGSNTVQSIFIMTKSEWNKLGINDTNADFEEVE